MIIKMIIKMMMIRWWKINKLILEDIPLKKNFKMMIIVKKLIKMNLCLKIKRVIKIKVVNIKQITITTLIIIITVIIIIITIIIPINNPFPHAQ